MASQRNGAGPFVAGLGRLVLVLALFGPGASPARAAERVAFQVDGVKRAGDGLSFGFTLPEGLSGDLARRLADGERVTVTYEVEVFRDRRLWFNAELAHHLVSVSALFDPVTRRYTLERELDGEAEGGVDAGQLEEARRWLTRLADLQVAVPAEKLDRKRVRWRARAILGDELVMLFVPQTVRSKWARGVVPERAGS